MDQGQHEKAATLFSKAVESPLGANDFEIIFGAATALRQTKQYEKAEKHFLKVADIRPHVSRNYELGFL